MVVKRVLIACVLAGSGAVGAGMADARDPLCPSNRGCIFDDKGYVGLLGTKYPGTGQEDVSEGPDNQTSSWQNRSRRNGAWYYEPDGDGKCNNLKKGKRDPRLSRPEKDDNDNLSSWRMNRLCRKR